MQIEAMMIGNGNPNELYQIREDEGYYYVFLDSPNHFPQNCSCKEWQKINTWGEPASNCKHVDACIEFAKDPHQHQERINSMKTAKGERIFVEFTDMKGIDIGILVQTPANNWICRFNNNSVRKTSDTFDPWIPKKTKNRSFRLAETRLRTLQEIMTSAIDTFGGNGPVIQLRDGNGRLLPDPIRIYPPGYLK